MKRSFVKVLAILLALLTLCAVGAVSVSAKPAADEDPSLGKTSLLTVLQWTWGLPQNLVGGAMVLFLDKYKIERFHEAYVVYAKPFQLFGREMRGCVSLGNFLFDIDERFGSAEEYAYESDNGIIHHEYGHTLQSAVLGPLYLFVIGVPSFLVSQRIIKYSGGYHDFYTEHWADLWASAWLGKP